MSEAALLRPGITAGSYPEREEERESWLDRTASAMCGALFQHLGGNNLDQNFLRHVEQASEGLELLPPQDLNEVVILLRQELHRNGLRPDLVARAFAVIRELSSRKLGMRHFDVQLLGGWAMMRGKIAEMETGEGKTLTATLPAATAALAGIPVHIITVNDFLAARDASWMKPLYDALGLSVGTILEGMSPPERRHAYGCSITYCTNKQVVFDYLKDRLLLQQESRALHLKLEALHREDPRSNRLVMRGLCFAIVDEADSVLVDEARTPLIISGKQGAGDQERLYRQALDAARRMQTGRDYLVREHERRIDLTDLGRAHAKRLTDRYGGVWNAPGHREDIMRQALGALYLYTRDKHYIVEEERVRIVDEYTGRVMADRSWERGLHQMVEAKEGLQISSRQETLARISYQRFFRRYLKLAGMTGTAQEVAGELWAVYRLDTVRIPTNRPQRRKIHSDLVYQTSRAKWGAIVDRVAQLHSTGRPVLVGTRSVADSEHISGLLEKAGLKHSVLNARQNRAEAEIVAQAGQPGRVTVATNMAGRGTDIKLAPGVAEAGGLFVIASERHEAGRIDRQLFGRSGRQGDPGEGQAIVSLHDELVRSVFGWLLDRLLARNAHLPDWLVRTIFGWAQRITEHRHGGIRKRLLRSDDSLQDLLAFSGRGE
ncbi:preprotein translocase subunit SecA [Rhodoplanes sp. Z2-YC6860]|uniref:preprotein translocase subunit SecA n=1 Tax=Rhodoplanes sp. Z2-YC6860 TaxID=674703 RepID=UPI00078BD8F5|nr:preprotein translocase subunit SecA [Rhodoplanes sp. Z2-YC6860]AMN41145.1 preprotein translocase SecA subunit [Rhodoplanes sp. Z2-YC6860]